MTAKSGLMLGLGEKDEEVVEVFRALRGAGVDVVTVGQYLRPSAWNLPGRRVRDARALRGLEARGMEMGFSAVFSGPVRALELPGGRIRDAVEQLCCPFTF